ncbi:GOLPH3/VPS74 family protein [Nocardioides sp. CPCC 205120]|uniref:GOLPH3/VPS74 family protein n=1 Tax=Nocardioides sp. CPCC 205120 TaxID=3406462 RepID=UPI003B505E33
MTLIAEDLLLLLLDDEDGTLLQQSFLDQALAGAVLAELAAERLVELGEERRWGAKPHVLPVRGARTDDLVLATALERVAEKPRDAQGLLHPLGKGLRDTLLERLAERGLLRREEGRVLGLFRRTTWPAVDSAHEEQVRDELEATLVHGRPAAPRAAALIGLLHAIGVVHRVVDREGVSASEVKRRAKAVAEGELASEAVGSAVQAMYVAIWTATLVPVITTTSS